MLILTIGLCGKSSHISCLKKVKPSSDQFLQYLVLSPSETRLLTEEKSAKSPKVPGFCQGWIISI
jgi:hypothetical protein